jgi:hypothetical protein
MEKTGQMLRLQIFSEMLLYLYEYWMWVESIIMLQSFLFLIEMNLI